MENEWADINGFSLYQINCCGKVKNKKTGDILKNQMNPEGYWRISLRGDDGKVHSFFVHRLVAEAFLPNPNGYNAVNHIDEDRSNSNVNNLEWISTKANASHGERRRRIAEAHEIPINEYDSTGKYLRTWKSVNRAANHYQCKGNTISHAMVYGSFAVGRFFKKWNGRINNINLDGKRILKKIDDYSVYGEINPDDLFEAKSYEERYEEIVYRERAIQTPANNVIISDMQFLEDYYLRLLKSKK